MKFWVDYLKIDPLLALSIDARFLDSVSEVIFDLKDRELEPMKITLASEGKGSRTKRSIDLEPECFRDWILHHDLEKLNDVHFGLIKDASWRAVQFVAYTQDVYNYKLPWILSAFWLFSKSILEEISDIELIARPLGRELLLLPSYVKFGVNTPAAAFYSSLGVNPAVLARQLGEIYELEVGQRFDYLQMMQWLQGLDLSALGAANAIKPVSFLKRLQKILPHIRPLKQAISSEHYWELSFYVAGWRYYSGDTIADKITEGVKLLLLRDEDNDADPYAVEIRLGETKLGYVPSCFSKEITQRLGSLVAVAEQVSLEARPHQRVRVRCFVLEE